MSTMKASTMAKRMMDKMKAVAGDNRSVKHNKYKV